MSALGSNPWRSQIASEFGSNTLNSLTSVRSLDAMYNHVFQASSGYSRDAFAGYGKPVISSLSASTSSTLGGKIDVSFTINEINNPDGNTWNRTNVQVQVSEDSGDREPTNWQNVGNSVAYSSTGVKSINGITVPNESTTYAVRILYWNYFNNVSADHLKLPVQSPYPTATSSAPNQFPRPIISSASKVGGSNVRVVWTYGEDPSSFSAQWRLQGSGTWDDLALSSSNNWGTSTNPKSALWNDGKIIPSGTHEVRIKADAEGGIAESNWSPIETFTS